MTSCESADALRVCLAALSPQRERLDVVVSDGSAVDPAKELAEVFGWVKFMHVDQPTTVPELRWSALGQTRGDVVGVIEAQAIPAPDWCARTLAAHQANPSAPACAGGVLPAADASWLGLGLYLCEYARFAPPLLSADSVCGLNCSFKRDAFEACNDLLEAGAWETQLCERWHGEGKRLATSDASVVFSNTLDWRRAIAQRYHYGRDYAACRGLNAWQRGLYSAGSVALAGLLTYRNLNAAGRKGLLSRLAPGLGWALVLNTVWAAGELTGYVFGRASRRRIM